MSLKKKKKKMGFFEGLRSVGMRETTMEEDVRELLNKMKRGPKRKKLRKGAIWPS